MAVYTFLEAFDFTGKTIHPLCTNEGSGLGSSEADIRRLCPGAVLKPGLAVTGGQVGSAREKIKNWIDA
jgi:flavodoxin